MQLPDAIIKFYFYLIKEGSFDTNIFWDLFLVYTNLAKLTLDLELDLVKTWLR